MSYTDDPLTIAAEAPTGIPESIREDADFYARTHADYWKATFRLRAFCQQHGPIPLGDGRHVGYFADGFAYDGDLVAASLPQLISSVTAELIGSQTDVERGLSVVLEEVPGLTVGKISRAVDKALATGVLRSGGEAADKLKAARVEKSKLSVR